MKSDSFLPESDRQQVRQAIEIAEKMTSGEIRVYMEDECGADVIGRAAFIFNKLEMSDTVLHNGVLIYIAVKDKKLAIIGDSGIHEKVGDDFWEEIKVRMTEQFKSAEYARGIVEAVHAAGKALSVYFPPLDNDRNELSDDIIFGEQ